MATRRSSILQPSRTAVPRLGGHILADALATQGVDTVFGVPGESYLAVLDGLYRHRERIRFVICRQEGGAAFMADAYAKLTGKPGVVMVTRGPGATNASIGVHAAFQDSVPMVVLVGQVGTDFIDREAFQEIDYRRMFGHVAKWVAQIDRADRIPEYVARAFQVATSGRMGPVVLALPEDVLAAQAEVADAARHQPLQAAPSPAQIERFAELLAGARRPLLLLGGTGWTSAACDDLRRFAEANQLPVACAFRFQDLFDNRHPQYAGDVGIGINPKLAQRMREADLIVAIGPRLGEMTTSGYSLIEAPRPRQRLVHVHAGVDELGTVYQAELMIAAGMPQFATAVRDLRVAAPAWAGTAAQAHAEYEAWQGEPPIYRAAAAAAGTGGTAGAASATPAAATAPAAALNLWQIMQTLKRMLPPDTLLANGAGNFATWGHRFWTYTGLRTQLASTSGAMGYGVPAAVAASIAQPERTVLCIAGDGDFLMNGQELATAVQYGGAPLIVVFNNGMYGTIRMHQEREYPARVLGTELVNPDFARYADAFGGLGLHVRRTEEFEAALAQALAHIRTQRRPALIELTVDPQALTPGATLDQIRNAKR
ncbi:MAG: thiamine pyrophosphate-binding protein [Burkholderiales bacterium]|nr:thiamine pyrophosphate-binding protein [Burkholderiales bacterium]